MAALRFRRMLSEELKKGQMAFVEAGKDHYKDTKRLEENLDQIFKLV